MVNPRLSPLTGRRDQHVAAKRRTEHARRRPEATPPARRPTAPLVLAILIVIAGGWAYATSFAGVLVLDDVRAIVRNPSIRTLWPPSTPLSPPSETTVSGRPVANFTLAVNYALAPPDARNVFVPANPGGEPGASGDFLRNIWGYHLLNFLVHLAAALALFGIVRRTLSTERLRARFGSPASWLALAVALLWLVHPLQTESVTYIVQRVESLMGLFYLLTLYCAIRAAEGRGGGAWMAGALLSCAFGMATKETMVTAPIMVWLWDLIFLDRSEHGRRRPLLIGLAATWIILGALVYYEHRAPSVDLGPAMIGRYLMTQAGVVTHYLRLSVVPSPLVFLYTWPMVASLGAVAPQATLLVGLVVLTIIGIVRRHPLGFAGAWFFLILAPTSTVLPIVTEVAAEHRMYLPLAAVIACAVVGAHAAGRTLLARVTSVPGSRRRAGFAVGAVLMLGLVAAYGTETRARNRDYWSEERLWFDTVSKQPSNGRARTAYGVVLAAARRFTEAETQLRIAVDIDAADPAAQGRLGSVLAAQGKLDESIVYLERALVLRPDDVDVHRSLGEVFAIRRDDAQAVRHLERARALDANDPVLLTHLAGILADTRDMSVRDGARAVELAEQAVRLTSGRSALALNVLAVALASVGRFNEAASSAAEALAIARAEGDQPLISQLEYRVAAYRALQQPRPPQ